MSQDNILREFNNLPPEAQRQVIDFMAFLQTRYQLASVKKDRSKDKLTTESFIGIWRDREDMQDSSAWVRKIRAAEWG